MSAGTLDSVRAHAGVQPDAPAIVDLVAGRRFTYGELDRAVDRAGAALQAAGLGIGERMAWLGRNSADMLIAHLAAERCGAIFVPLNWRLAADEIRALVADAAPLLLVTDDAFAERVEGLASDALAISTTGAFGARLAATSASFHAVEPDIDRTVLLLYTSGTSGHPKAARVSTRNMFHGAANFAIANRLTAESVYLCDMPLFHVAGLQAVARSTLLAGAMLAISAGFDAALTIRRIADPALKVTHYFCVTQMAQRLREHPDFDPIPFRSLGAFSTGGAPNPPAAVRAWVRDGIPMMDGYGMTECGCCFGMPPGDLARFDEKAGSIGPPFVSIEARIVDETGQDVVDGEPGELWLRGPNISSVYWNRPAESAEFFAGGWAHTGDMARRDADGFYYILERKKDMYVSGGENVYPAEVEAVIAEIPGVADVAVIGVADGQWGETGCAYVVGAVEDSRIRTHCRARIAAYKHPKHIRFADELPRTASGKLQKHVLRERYRQNC